MKERNLKEKKLNEKSISEKQYADQLAKLNDDMKRYELELSQQLKNAARISRKKFKIINGKNTSC